MTQVIRSPLELKKWRKNVKGTVGFVPTMGALHEGHEQLLKQARANNDVVVLSIFVNPTQFNDPNDLAKYPKTWDADLKMAENNAVDVIFYPIYDEMYPDGYRFKVIENEFSKLLCGADRPGHFDGVLSVVMKLLNIVDATHAYFGEKDYQQLTLIRDMVKNFFMNVQIVPVPTMREKDGLAMSSRNTRLSPEDRKRAPEIYKAITQSPSASVASEKLTALGFKVDYVTDLNNRRFVAAHIGGVRLIDNVQI
jgi:pantoate--beta-alanine ligase